MPLTLPTDGYQEHAIVSSADAWDYMMASQYVAATAPASALFPTIGLGIFVPFRLTRARTYTRAWWLNGTAVAGNADLGVYTISGTTGTKVQSIGATAQAGTSAMQTVTISWTFQPGLYYLAFSHSEATTGQYWRSNVNLVVNRVSGCYQATSQSPLAASPTIATMATSYMPYFGLAEQAVV